MFSDIFFAQTWDDTTAYLTPGTYMLLVAEKTDFDVHKLPENVRVCGAIFPRIIFGTRSFDEGMLIAKLHDETSFSIAPLMHTLDTITIHPTSNAIVAIVDGLSSHIDSFLETLFSIIPEKSKIIGAGAGKLTLQQEPVIFTNEAIFENAALLLQSPYPISLGVKHGWEAIVSPLMATQCSSHLLEKINFHDAYMFYTSAVETDSPLHFTRDNFFDIAKAYPIGIVRYGKDYIVRDPIFSDGKSLTLVGSIDTNSVIAILKGDPAKLIDAAEEAAKLASTHASTQASSTFIIDCISRYLFLEDAFTDELKAISTHAGEGHCVWGVLSLGEIANANDESIEFYNKTCVVSAL